MIKTKLHLSFNTVLIEHRIKKKLTQEQLAKASGLDRSYISMLEREERQPSLETIFRLANAFQIKPSKFVLACEKATQANQSENNNTMQ